MESCIKSCVEMCMEGCMSMIDLPEYEATMLLQR